MIWYAAACDPLMLYVPFVAVVVMPRDPAETVTPGTGLLPSVTVPLMLYVLSVAVKSCVAAEVSVLEVEVGANV